MPVGDPCPWLLRLRIAGSQEHAPDPPDPDDPAVHVWRTQADETVALGFRTDGRCWMHWPSFATYGFSADDPFITAYSLGDHSPERIEDIYSRSVLPMALQALGLEALHASAVLDARGVVLFAGRSKTGKSTVAYGLSSRGYRQWSDDGVVFRLSDGGAEALPLSFSVRLRPSSSGLVGVAPTAARRLPSEAPAKIAAVCLLSHLDEQGGPAARVDVAHPAAAFQGLLVHAHEFDPTDPVGRQRMVKAYLGLAASVPIFTIALRTGREHFEEVLDSIVDAIGLRAAAERHQLAGAR